MTAAGGMPCRICGAPTRPGPSVHGSYSGRDYELRRCPACGFAFVGDPWLDYAAIYDDRYYAGEGADPSVDYRFELDHPDRTIRGYEWTGIARAVAALVPSPPTLRWLDFGCGNGGLVRYVRARAGHDAVGFEEGSIADAARARGIPILRDDELDGSGPYDVVTAIEVLEHTLDPVAELRRVRGLLRPGGLLFVTTGNAAPFADRLERWRYLTPEIHISFFEPQTLARAFELAGLRPEHRGRVPGFEDILTFKVLKNLGVRRRSRFTDLLPRRVVGAAADRYTRLSDHPIGRAV